MAITLQNDILGISTFEQKEAIKTTCQIKGERRQRNKEKLESIRRRMTEIQRITNESNLTTGTSNWLTCLPITKNLATNLTRSNSTMLKGFVTTGQSPSFHRHVCVFLSTLLFLFLILQKVHIT